MFKKEKIQLVALRFFSVMLVLVLSGCASSRETKQSSIITPQEVHALMTSDTPFVLLDVRNQDEFEEKHLPGALLIPVTDISARIEQEIPDKETFIIIYCRSGRRSADAALMLVELGYLHVYDLGGINDWPFETE